MGLLLNAQDYKFQPRSGLWQNHRISHVILNLVTRNKNWFGALAIKPSLRWRGLFAVRIIIFPRSFLPACQRACELMIRFVRKHISGWFATARLDCVLNLIPHVAYRTRKPPSNSKSESNPKWASCFPLASWLQLMVSMCLSDSLFRARMMLGAHAYICICKPQKYWGCAWTER